ncbi:MAG: hypothetical protein COA96_17680 [SAR86 cluster bacterium]|uniref:Uncharacterized protein n=1 Tax=SAR86 cluster bacterium TaxID=2030880 RepID=A0A2A5AE51_9GAMM|nr:MAG: hypothetical protein COA96_17680 [SAR86 cluster bacterium]
MSLNFFRQYKLLTPKFKAISDLSSITGGVLGFIVLIPYAWVLNSVSGIDPNECIKCQEGGIAWMVGLIAGMVVFVVLSMTFILWIRVKPFLRNREISEPELKELLLWRSYPASWLKTGT